MGRLFLLLSCLSLAACANVPELDEQITDEARAAPRPVLEPLGPITAQAEDAALTAEVEAALIARAALLEARADAVRAGQ